MLAIPWFSLKFSVFYHREKEPRSGCRKIWQTMFAKLVLPPCAPADISAQRKFVIWRKNATNILTRFRGKYFFRGFLYGSKKGIQTEANSHEIQCEHNLVAALFVCGKSVLAWDAGCGASKTLRRQHCGVAPPLQSYVGAFRTFRLRTN